MTGNQMSRKLGSKITRQNSKSSMNVPTATIVNSDMDILNKKLAQKISSLSLIHSAKFGGASVEESSGKKTSFNKISVAHVH